MPFHPCISNNMSQYQRPYDLPFIQYIFHSLQVKSMLRTRGHQMSHRWPTVLYSLNPFNPDSAKSKTDKFFKIINWVKQHSEVLLDSFPMNGHTLGFCSQNQKLANFVSPKVSLWESRVNKQHHSKVLLNSFPMHGHTLGVCP